MTVSSYVPVCQSYQRKRGREKNDRQKTKEGGREETPLLLMEFYISTKQTGERRKKHNGLLSLCVSCGTMCICVCSSMCLDASGSSQCMDKFFYIHFNKSTLLTSFFSSCKPVQVLICMFHHSCHCWRSNSKQHKADLTRLTVHIGAHILICPYYY